jgi:hypothetical protein
MINTTNQTIEIYSGSESKPAWLLSKKIIHKTELTIMNNVRWISKLKNSFSSFRKCVFVSIGKFFVDQSGDIYPLPPMKNSYNFINTNTIASRRYLNSMMNKSNATNQAAREICFNLSIYSAIGVIESFGQPGC